MQRREGLRDYDGKIAGLYDLEKTLGRGHFAVVKLARHVFTGEKVAVKVIDKNKLDEVSRAHLFQEVRCMKLVQHPNVVRLYEVIDTQTKLYLILELGDGGDLYDYIMPYRSGLPEEVARTYFRQIVRAISYCHHLHVVHRDLKLENVVFFEKLGTVKLTDFGFSNRFCPGQKLDTLCGSLAYSAPEILLGDSYDAPAVDVWSLGVILYILVSGQPPFQKANDSETLTMIIDCKYSIPEHVSDDCKRLIARMLVKKPEGRATLKEIAADPWLTMGTDGDPVETLPLVSRQEVSEENHNFIITKMVNGNIATKEEILEALDKNAYNHITATYFLLAERKLRAHRQEQMQKRRPELLDVSSSRSNDISMSSLRADAITLTTVNQSLLTVPRTPGDVPQNARTRKCSIVQEEEDEDDVSSCSGRDENSSSFSSFNRRGSRSEGKLSHVVQERLSQLPEKTLAVAKISTLRQQQQQQQQPQQQQQQQQQQQPHRTFTVKTCDEVSSPDRTITVAKVKSKETSEVPTVGAVAARVLKKSLCSEPESRPKSVTECLSSPIPLPANKLRTDVEHRASLPLVGEKTKTPLSLDSKLTEPVATTILTESCTAPSPLRPSEDHDYSKIHIQKYNTMPAPGSVSIVASSTGQLPLNEILEDADAPENCGNDGNSSKFRLVRRTGYEQRRNKFHKTRTTSCSSSDASDDDSEGRKKRAHKLGATSSKPLPTRRDSHDDSSDSQDPGGSGGGGGGPGLGNGETVHENSTADTTSNDNNQSSTTTTTTTTTTTDGKVHRCTDNPELSFRRHRAGRRFAGETKLRESQSLNRITEVQEAEAPSCHVNSRNTPTTQSISSSSSSSSSVSRNLTQSSATSTITQQNSTVQRAKGFGARLLQSMSLAKSAINPNQSKCQTNGISGIKDIIKQSSVRRADEKALETAKDDKNRKKQNGCANTQTNQQLSCDRDNNFRANANRNDCKSRKMRFLSRYFAVHKKLCVPLPGLFAKGRLYKARSCGNIARDRVSPPSPKSMLLCTNALDDKWRERKQLCDLTKHQQQPFRGGHRGSDGDINQNLGIGQLMMENVVGKTCVGLPTICHIHLGDPSKCCSLC